MFSSSLSFDFKHVTPVQTVGRTSTSERTLTVVKWGSNPQRSDASGLSAISATKEYVQRCQLIWYKRVLLKTRPKQEIGKLSSETTKKSKQFEIWATNIKNAKRSYWLFGI